MNLQDCFVGGISTLLGVLFIIAAVSNSEWFFQTKKMSRLDGRVGRRAARLTSLVGGLLMIVLGAAIALGVTPRFHSSSPATSAHP